MRIPRLIRRLRRVKTPKPLLKERVGQRIRVSDRGDLVQELSVALVLQRPVGHLPDLARLQSRPDDVPGPLLSQPLVDP